jgi:acetyl-CoA synthetase
MNFNISTLEQYNEIYKNSIDNPAAFWDSIAEQYEWSERWITTVESEFDTPSVQWFVGGKTNITINCIDRHLVSNANKTAIIWEPNNPQNPSKKYTYQQLHDEVCQMSNTLLSMGVKKGDRVCIYMPMVPELAFAVLACARIGAIHSVVFAGFSATALADRISDAQAHYVITSDGMSRGDKVIEVKKIVDDAITISPIVKKTLVVKVLGDAINIIADRDVIYDEVKQNMSKICTPIMMDSEDMLFILYTSGSTGTPKGVVHTVGGYMVYAGYSFATVFDYQPGEVHWCTADIGWVTGHSYIVYGPLLCGATTLMFEGIPTYPDAGRFWEVIDKHQVNIFYTAPTAIRSLMTFGEELIQKYKLTSLRKLGSVGEPINEEAWHWYDRNIGKGKCPIADTWWQTETGGVMMTSLLNVHTAKPSYTGYPLPGIVPVLLDQNGVEIVENDVEGYLCIKSTWPSILRTTYGDHERCRINYFAAYKGMYFTGDGARRDENGMYRIIGRVDDVINVSGHRFGTAEIENAINQNENVIESAVIGYPHDLKGQGIYAYIIVKNIEQNHDELKASIISTVVKEIGPIAKPDKIQIVDGLPKTRSGKIMRRILRKIGEGEFAQLGDTTTLLDPSVVERIIDNRM